eukprot:GDKJ01052642.1.p1 GENE.GDKJ01052642.1~~GDKJ01052642.1.p1  ORF type:complete len:503 (+),score=71.37 GDKJ01052642.1:21-1529(+)
MDRRSMRPVVDPNKINCNPTITIEDFLNGIDFSEPIADALSKPLIFHHSSKNLSTSATTATNSLPLQHSNGSSLTEIFHEHDINMPDLSEIIHNCDGRVKELLVCADVLHAQRECMATIDLIKSLYPNLQEQVCHIQSLLKSENVQNLLFELSAMSNFLGPPDNGREWTELRSSLSRLRIWCREEREKVYSLKVVGIMHSPMPHILCMLSDATLCKDWFPMTGSCDEIAHAHQPHRIGTAVNYVVQSLPWPVTNREWLVQQAVSIDDVYNCIHYGLRSLPEELFHVSLLPSGTPAELAEKVRVAKLNASKFNYGSDPIGTAKAKTENVKAQLAELQLTKLGLTEKSRAQKFVRGEMIACGVTTVPLDESRTFVEARLCTDMKMTLPSWLMLQMTKQVGQDAFVAMEKLSTFPPQNPDPSNKKAKEMMWKWDLLDKTRSSGFFKKIDEIYETASHKAKRMTASDKKKQEETLLAEAFVRPEKMNRVELLNLAEELNCLSPDYL